MNLSSQHNLQSIADKKEISVILKYGTKYSTCYGPVFFYNNKKCKKNKVGILVKKNIGKAFYRNYIKRVLRFYIRTELTLFKDFNRVIFIYRNNVKTNFNKISSEYNLKLRRLTSN